jgi:segregation and condensation protein B
MFDGRLPGSMAIPLPSDDPMLRTDEDPLEADLIEDAVDERINAAEAPLDIELEDADAVVIDDDIRVDPLADERKH